MTDLLLQYGLSNGVLALLVAGVAWAVHASGRRPGLSHLLWLVVLVKLVTPPILSLPVVTLPQWATSNAATQPAEPSPEFVMPGLSTPDNPASLDTNETLGVLPGGIAMEAIDMPTKAEVSSTAPAAVSPWAARWALVKRVLVGAWLLGTLVVLLYTLMRVVRFNRLLQRATLPAPATVQRTAQQVARQLGLKKAPAVYTSAARLSPMVWWVGGRVRVVLPETVAIECVPGRLRWVLAHELAHVKRRDYLVRWVEWLACVTFWWNPVAWWARNNLRMNEEVCCDALVLAHFSNNNDTPTSYADAILSVVESLARPALRPPAIASELSNGGTLQRRFGMILSSKTITKAPRWAKTLVLLGAVGLVPLGVAQASEPITKLQDQRELNEREVEEKAEAMMTEIRAAVDSGDLTPEEGQRKAEAVRRWVMALEADVVHEHGEHDGAHAREHDDAGIAGHLRRMGIDEEGYDRIIAYLSEQGLGRMQIEPTLGGIVRIAHGMHTQGERYELGDDMVGYLTREVGLDEEQLEAALAVSQKIAELMREQDEHANDDADGDDDVDIRSYFLRLGMDEAGFDRMVNTLHEHGVGRVQMEPTLGGLFHTVLAIREHGAEHAMENIDENDFFSAHVGLSGEQIEVVARFAMRLAELEPREADGERRDRDRALRNEPGERDQAERGEQRERARAERRERREREREREEQRERDDDPENRDG